jgi:guanylate kinase
MGNVLIISGAPKTGKTHIGASLARFPGMIKPPFFSSRQKGQGEIDGVDAIFKTRQDIEQMKQSPSEYLVTSTKNNLIALSIAQLISITRGERACGCLIVPPELGAQLAMHEALSSNPRIITVFISPASLATVVSMKLRGISRLERFFYRRFVERDEFIAKDHGKPKSEPDRKYVELLKEQTMAALRLAHHFQCVIPSPDWSGHPNWKATPVAGDAGNTLSSVFALLKGQEPKLAEKWPKDLFA